MRSRWIALFLLTAVVLVSPYRGKPTQAQLSETPPRPKLVIVIIIDQFRPDYLVRFRPWFVEGGFNLLLGGANFLNCRYDYALTATGPGHATLFAGADPNIHGIIGNEWFDRGLNRKVNCVEDDSTKLVETPEGGSSKPGASPHYLVGSTVGDELRAASNFKSKVIGISLKDRGAILPAGHAGNAAYWYDPATGLFVTSTYYLPALPQWVGDFNRSSPARAYCGKNWQAIGLETGKEGQVLKSFTLPGKELCPGPRFLHWLEGTPFISQVELNFALEAIKNERLGQGPSTDLLTISLSANDYIGHAYGPYSAEVADMTLRTDRYLADFFNAARRLVGDDNLWIALSADHGVAPNPKFIAEHRLGIAHAHLQDVVKAIQQALSGQFGQDQWISWVTELEIYLNRDALRRHNVEEDRAELVAAKAAQAAPGVFMAMTRSQLVNARLPDSPLAQGVANNFSVHRSGDIFIILEPFAVPVETESGTTHGTPWNYDAHVPLLFWGTRFNPGVYAFPCRPADLAPTLSVALGLNRPSGAQGKPLTQALK